MIKMTRVDHRLLHGQVAFTWIKFTGSDCILIANDAVARDELRMAALRLAKPEGAKLVIKSVADSAKAINSGVTDRYNLFVITENIHDACRLAKATDAITQVNVGGVKAEEGKRKISDAVYVSDDEANELRELAAQGRQVFSQMTPNDQPHDIIELLG
ncbi:PTS sugar transporter subunit IIB [Thermophilibacter sp.]